MSETPFLAHPQREEPVPTLTDSDPAIEKGDSTASPALPFGIYCSNSSVRLHTVTLKASRRLTPHL